MTADARPTKVELNNLDLACPASGEPCPSRMNIAELCAPGLPPNPTYEELQASEDDGRKRTGFLVAHNCLFNKYGCSGPDGDQCPPSVASNQAKMVRGAKQIIKRFVFGRSDD